MKNHNFRRILSAAALALVLVLFVGAAFAEETVGADATSMKAIAAAVTNQKVQRFLIDHANITSVVEKE